MQRVADLFHLHQALDQITFRTLSLDFALSFSYKLDFKGSSGKDYGTHGLN